MGRKLTREEEQKLSSAIEDAKGIAIKHRELDTKIAKEAHNMSLSEIKFNKERLASLAKSLRAAVRKVIKCGGTWDNEQERILLGNAV